MHGPSFRRALATTWLLLAGPVLADDESLPAPRPVPVAPAPVSPALPPPGHYRVDRRAVWQYYQVDRFGQWRPLVVWGPYGAYYLSNGKPFPWATTNNREVLSNVVGTPYRAP